MTGVKAHCWGSSPLYWAATSLSVLLPIISIGSLVSKALKKERSTDLLLLQAIMRYATLNPFRKQEAMHFAWLGGGA